MLHLLRWELKRAIWWLAAIGALSVLAASAAAFDVWGTGVAVIPVFVLVVAGVAVAVLMVSDAPLDATAHWVGRPIDAASLFLAKLIAALVCFFGVPLAMQWVVQVRGGVPIERAFGDLVLSAQMVLSWLLVAMAVGAVSRSIRGIVVGTLVVMLFTGLSSLLLYNAAFGFSVGVRAPLNPAVLTALYRISLLAPVAIVGWVYLRRPSVVWARSAVVLLLLFRVFTLLLTLGRGGDPGALRAVRDAWVIDSVSLEDSIRLRVAYHVNGQTDSTGILPEVARGQYLLRTNRIDTAYFVGEVRENEPADSRGAMRDLTDRGDMRSLRRKLVRSGVLLLQSPRPLVSGGSLDASILAAQFRLGDSISAPLRIGTVFQHRSRRIGLLLDSSRGDAHERVHTWLFLGDLSGGVQMPVAAELNPLQYLELSVASTQHGCCTPLETRYALVEESGIVFPGIRRIRQKALLGDGPPRFAADEMRLVLREWKLVDVLEHRASAHFEPPVRR
ncbi:MAG: hypothetical protein K2R93_01095 [Gemmatimonadaceae bacterium]|nr:hypothetical protein [Gemmatimonadaceae bacterium]